MTYNNTEMENEMKKQNKQGFTLAELLIVVAIIAILVSIAIPIFTNNLRRAKAAVDLSSVRSAKAAAAAEYLTDGATGQKTYYFDNGVIKTSSDGIKGYGKSDTELPNTRYNLPDDYADGIPLNAYVQVTITADGTITASWIGGTSTSSSSDTTTTDPSSDTSTNPSSGTGTSGSDSTGEGLDSSDDAGTADKYLKPDKEILSKVKPLTKQEAIDLYSYGSQWGFGVPRGVLIQDTDGTLILSNDNGGWIDIIDEQPLHAGIKDGNIYSFSYITENTRIIHLNDNDTPFRDTGFFGPYNGGAVVEYRGDYYCAIKKTNEHVTYNANYDWYQSSPARDNSNWAKITGK